MTKGLTFISVASDIKCMVAYLDHEPALFTNIGEPKSWLAELAELLRFSLHNEEEYSGRSVALDFAGDDKGIRQRVSFFRLSFFIQDRMKALFDLSLTLSFADAQAVINYTESIAYAEEVAGTTLDEQLLFQTTDQLKRLVPGNQLSIEQLATDEQKQEFRLLLSRVHNIWRNNVTNFRPQMGA